MTHRLQTPIALLLAALMLACISLIPAADRDPSPVPAHLDLAGWVATLPFEREEHRLVVVLAVHAAAWAIDAAIIEHGGRDGESDALTGPGSEPERPAAERRNSRTARPMMPFYSFAAPASRPQES